MGEKREPLIQEEKWGDPALAVPSDGDREV